MFICSFADGSNYYKIFYVCVGTHLLSVKMELNKIKIKKSIIYSIIAFFAGFIYLIYSEPKPIESIGHIGLIILTAFGYMLASFLAATIVLLILMVFIKRIKGDFWNYSTFLMVGGVKLLVLSNLFI